MKIQTVSYTHLDVYKRQGMDRYFQIVKCFRDEDLRADRQPEFTQIDCEMSFVDENDVMTMMENMIGRIFKEIHNIDIQLPLKRMTYKEAMDRFGSDKPDTRFAMELDVYKRQTQFLQGMNLYLYINIVLQINTLKLHLIK